MNSKRSYLDTLNAGRPRRSYTTLEELNRSLDHLQQRLGRHMEPEAELPRSFAELRERSAHDVGTAEQAYQTIARDLDNIRSQEDGVAAFGKIANELKTLREDLRQQVSSGMRREFEAMRRDIERVGQSPANRDAHELNLEFERLSGAIQALSERADDKSLNLLRLELEQVKGAVDTLAREETVLSVDRRWDDFDRRWTDFEGRVASSQTQDPAIAALTQRLEQISNAVDNLPESLSLRSLEEKVRMLAGAVEHFARQNEHRGGETFNQIEERLDEISRAIVASTAAITQANFDPEPFERIEARISSLARQIEEVANDHPPHEVIERLTLLSQRVDEITTQVRLPEAAVERIGQQIAGIAEKIDRAPVAPDADHIFQGIEQRLDLFSTMIERRQGDALEQSNMLFRDLERRLDEVADRLDQRAHVSTFDNAGIMEAIDVRFSALAERFGADEEAVRGLETRLDDISRRLDSSAQQFAGIDPELIRNLEAQVAGLSEHLARPTNPLPEFEDIAPRLDVIERSIASSHESLLEAARQAAESAVRSMVGSASQSEAVSGLAEDLRTLEALTRRSDERNTKTFEAIHDTLLKIVDRLGSLEHTDRVEAMPQPEHAAPQKMAVQDTPSLDFDASLPLMGVFDDLQGPSPADRDGGVRSPAEAAVAAAVASALDSDAIASDKPVAASHSRLGGLMRAFSGRKREKAEKPAVDAPVAEQAEAVPSVDLDMPLDPDFANRPLEPGSGAPDLNAIMRRVRDERGQQVKPAETDAARADFIAAARRRAQAAAAEVEALKNSSELKGPVRAVRFGDMLKARRKPILMAAAAIMMALAGLQLGKALMTDGVQVATDATPQDANKAEDAAELGVTETPAVETAKVESASQPDVEAKAAEAKAPDPQPVETAQAPTMADQPAAPVAAMSSFAAANPAPAAFASQTKAAALPAASAPVTAQQPAAPVFDAASKTAAIVVPVEAGPAPLREAAAAGDAKALFEIGSRYADGRGVATDNKTAAQWYEKAAELGLAPAQYRIGNFYEKGIGVESDLGKAKLWYQLAANQGNASAMHNLAVLFAMGADGTPDNESAVRWFSQAAELGVKDSQFNLGILAAKGVGMQQNLEDSYKWFAIVATSGDKDAASKRDEIGKALRPEQLQRARAAAELWKPKQLDAYANAVDVPAAWQEDHIKTASVDVKEAVKSIQAILSKNGYHAGGADGVMGQKTKDALAAFQKANGMQPTGEVDEKVVRALLALK
ncbi:peptidoglycan-binding protein [Pseudaminobacter soli (ex Li et al. 2025)]|uniref:Peptidoglycan-binding protein n=1 Tax=Pseudaminobacter soli (ex Li et al. 2025) TaxID=1295366 RepID=A0A2P7SD86_9HYPH|nr:peptidoglycan-binding protein [Mesorhizobium soli]PSJ60305.1 peptidoglycan-binding protein [Mesorhizobium soli]